MGVNFESSKEIFNALEDIDKDVLARFDVLSRLRTPPSQDPARVGSQEHVPRGEHQHQRKPLVRERKPVESVSVRYPQQIN